MRISDWSSDVCSSDLGKATAFVGRLRRALALATLRHQTPDLVILDEFQRYRQILDEKDQDPLLKALLGSDGAATGPAVLLLSATPYRLLSTRWDERSEEHTSELQSLMRISYAVFCLKKKKKNQ